MERINETRQIIRHGTCECVCRLTSSVCNSRQRWNGDKCRCECKEDLIDNGICDKGFMWNPSNCGCECDKSCGIGEYIDKSCVCRNTLIDKLVEECTNVIEENKVYNKTLDVTLSNDCASCTLCCIICSVFNNKCNNWWCFCLFLL